MVRLLVALALAGCMSIPGFAQANSSGPETRSANTQKQFYRLDFVVQELEKDRVVNSRAYSTIMSENKASSIRAGEKLPFTSAIGANAQWQQIDIGVSIDCRKLEVTSNGVSLNVKAEISSVLENQGTNSPPSSPPIIRNNQWESNVVLPLKKPAVIFSSDDPASKRTMQLKLTVSPI